MIYSIQVDTKGDNEHVLAKGKQLFFLLGRLTRVFLAESCTALNI